MAIMSLIGMLCIHHAAGVDHVDQASAAEIETNFRAEFKQRLPRLYSSEETQEKAINKILDSLDQYPRQDAVWKGTLDQPGNPIMWIMKRRSPPHYSFAVTTDPSIDPDWERYGHLWEVNTFQWNEGWRLIVLNEGKVLEDLPQFQKCLNL